MGGGVGLGNRAASAGMLLHIYMLETSDLAFLRVQYFVRSSVPLCSILRSVLRLDTLHSRSRADRPRCAGENDDDTTKRDTHCYSH